MGKSGEPCEDAIHALCVCVSTHVGEYLLLLLARAPLRIPWRPDTALLMRVRRHRPLLETHQRPQRQQAMFGGRAGMRGSVVRGERVARLHA